MEARRAPYRPPYRWHIARPIGGISVVYRTYTSAYREGGRRVECTTDVIWSDMERYGGHSVSSGYTHVHVHVHVHVHAHVTCACHVHVHVACACMHPQEELRCICMPCVRVRAHVCACMCVRACACAWLE